MQTNKTLRNFWDKLESANKAALLLDYDGTLAPFTVVRDQAVPYTGIREILTDISGKTCTRVVVISGRSVDALLPLLDLSPQPEIWGCHGWEKKDMSGHRTLFPLPDMAEKGLDIARKKIREHRLDQYCEPKPASIAIHWRGFDAIEVERLKYKVQLLWRDLASEHGLDIHPFNGGLELRCPGKDKGTALATILEGIEPGTPVAFLGDDLTDEDGFRAIKNTGIGILVNSNLRETEADLQIKPPQELIDFLTTWREKAPKLNKSKESG